MSFSARVEAHHKLAYSNNVLLVTQQMGSKLRPYVTEVPCTGEAHDAAELIGKVDYIRGDGSRSRSNIENVPKSERRWLIRPPEIKSGQYIDKEDIFDSINYPTSKIVTAHTIAVNTGVDDIILGVVKKPDGSFAVEDGGILGGAVTGKRPGARVGLPSLYRTVHGGTGLTIGKLRAGRKRLGLDENDLSRVTPVMAISTEEHDDLLGIVETASANLNMLEQPHIVEGKVKRLLGFNFVEINRLPVEGGVRACPIWTKDNIALGIWQDVQGDMWNDTHADNRPYARVDAYMDSVRIQDNGIHVVECTAD